MSTDPREPYRVRASDAEREQYAQILRAAMTEGRLTLEEGEERLAQVYAVKYRDELAPLTADLPPAERAASATSTPVGWRGLLTALLTLVRAEIAATAAAGFRSRRFLVTALVVLGLLGGLALVVGHGLFDGGHGDLVSRGER
jgi:Domain of unknown function (DUF1707)